ncbi:copper chaperone PCu(A)C [Pseudoduganella sp. GCM10020061]|uniref:copper chaperone PCu(A)C n=1 Tax=Pseudoduganella sp. GCM10020061 TaxID=3317345 RepID=UPI0036276DDA
MKLFPYAAAVLLACAAQASAQVTVSDAWVRATVPAQKTSGAFMRVTSPVPARLVSVSTPLAGLAELHKMEMKGDQMKMAAVDAVELPAGKEVNLASGGYHVMLMDLKRQLKPGETVPLTLDVVTGKDKHQTVLVNATVRPITTTAPAHKH